MTLPLADVQAILGLQPDQIQVLAHENTACLDPYFNESNFITLAGNAVQVPVVTFALPAGMLGILRAVAMQPSDLTHLNDIVWQVRLNGTAPVGLDRIRGPMSTFLFPLNLDIGLFDGWVVEVVASNLTAVDIPNTWAMVRGNFFGRSAR